MNKYRKIVDALNKFPKKSNKEIAARVGVSASYVYKVKSARDDITTDNNNDAVGHDATSNGLSWELPDKTLSDGSTAAYYELPSNANELQDLISYRDMNAQIGEIFRSCYRYGIASHSDKLRDAKKIKFYIDAEIKRLEKGNFLN
jgi:DNA-binding Lrp family transcriptional regulator|tara:strand:+ start:3485 stop:3919 length:435 start_codon:yes stop_codon:yes gene_type:complete